MAEQSEYDKLKKKFNLLMQASKKAIAISKISMMKVKELESINEDLLLQINNSEANPSTITRPILPKNIDLTYAVIEENWRNGMKTTQNMIHQETNLTNDKIAGAIKNLMRGGRIDVDKSGHLNQYTLFLRTEDQWVMPAKTRKEFKILKEIVTLTLKGEEITLTNLLFNFNARRKTNQSHVRALVKYYLILNQITGNFEDKFEIKSNIFADQDFRSHFPKLFP